MKAETRQLILIKVITRCLKQCVGADDVGLDKLAGAVDGAIHMRLGGKVHDGIGLMLVKNAFYFLRITDINVFKSIAITIAHVL